MECYCWREQKKLMKNEKNEYRYWFPTGDNNGKGK
jgi:hypothetical protein